MDPKKTQAGQKFAFSASLYNDLVDTVKWAKTQRRLDGSGQSGGDSSPTVLMVQNKSVSTVPRFGVLEVSGQIGGTQDFENLKALKGVLPTSALKPVVVLQNAAAADQISEAVVGGTTMAAVTVTATSDTHAEPVAGSYRMKTGTAGRFRILQPLTSTGDQNILVRFESAASSTGLPKIKNESGYTVPEWGFLMIDGVVTSPTDDLAGFKSSPVFRGTAPRPHTTFSNKRVVSVPGGAAPGETVDCVLDGRVPARIYSPNRTDPLMAHLANESSIQDVTRLGVSNHQSNYGFPILYRETGTGEKWGLIDLMPQNQPAVFAAKSVGPGGTSTALTPWTYDGNPWQIGDILQNGLCRILPSSTALHFDGATAWIGSITFTFGISYANLRAAGTSGFYYLPGYNVSMYVRTPGFTTAVHHSSGVSSPPSLIGPSDRLRITSGAFYTGALQQTLTVPLLLQSAVGNLEKNLTSLSVVVSLTPVGDLANTNVQISVNPSAISVQLHEVDPLLPKYYPATGTINSGGTVMGSGKVADPLLVGRSGVTSGAMQLTSRLGGSSSVSTGTGIE